MDDTHVAIATEVINSLTADEDARQDAWVAVILSDWQAAEDFKAFVKLVAWRRISNHKRDERRRRKRETPFTDIGWQP